MNNTLPDRRHLIMLSGPMGTGHVQASSALESHAKEQYPDMKVTHLNVVTLMTPGLRIFFTTFYHFMLRHFSILWRYMYHSSNVPPEETPLFRKGMRLWRQTFERRLIKFLQEQNPDYIICTHFLAAEVVSKAKTGGKITCLTASVVTDFSVHWVYIQPAIDLFFVANQDMALIMHLRGIDREKIYITGCPIFPKFYKKYTAAEKKALSNELGLPPDAKFAMVMMGGENIGRVSAISKKLLKSFPSVSVISMTGKDKNLLKQMNKIAQQFPGRLFPTPHTTRVNDYMALCYMVITKPGGITISECIAMKKPVIIMDPIPGHEEKNATYLATHGLAAFSETLSDLSYIDAELGATWMQMVSEFQENNHKHNSAANIIKVVIEWEGCRDIL